MTVVLHDLVGLSLHTLERQAGRGVCDAAVSYFIPLVNHALYQFRILFRVRLCDKEYSVYILLDILNPFGRRMA